MRRAPTLSLLLAPVALAASGCASAPESARADEHRSVTLAGGDRVGRMMFRDAPDFAVAAATTHTTDADIATVDTDAAPN